MRLDDLISDMKTNDKSDLIGGRYKVGKKIGEGGMGRVHMAHDTRLDRDVAIKFLKSDVMEEEGSVEGFFYECTVLGRLEHPGVLPITDSGIDGNGIPYCVMKVVKGQTLGDLLHKHKSLNGKERQDSVIRLLRIFSKLCETLSFVHHEKYIHRDVKPDNIMVDKFGIVLLVDWGLARPMASADDRHDSSKTSTGLIKGTPLYMSPEQITSSSQTLDGRSDLFALGIILYEIIVGRTPFEAMDPYAILHKIKLGKYTPPEKARPDVPPPLASIINKTLSTETDGRYQTTAELGADINGFLDGSTVVAHTQDMTERFSTYLTNNPSMKGAMISIAIISLILCGYLLIT